jgi:hypothetical protein
MLQGGIAKACGLRISLSQEYTGDNIHDALEHIRSALPRITARRIHPAPPRAPRVVAGCYNKSITIAVLSGGERDVELFDALGRRIFFRHAASPARYRVRDIRSGACFLRCSTGGGYVFVKRIMNY